MMLRAARVSGIKYRDNGQNCRRSYSVSWLARNGNLCCGRIPHFRITTSAALRAANTPIMQAVKVKTCLQEYTLPARQGQLHSCCAISNSPACGLEFFVIRVTPALFKFLGKKALIHCFFVSSLPISEREISEAVSPLFIFSFMATGLSNSET